MLKFETLHDQGPELKEKATKEISKSVPQDSNIFASMVHAYMIGYKDAAYDRVTQEMKENEPIWKSKK